MMNGRKNTMNDHNKTTKYILHNSVSILCYW